MTKDENSYIKVRLLASIGEQTYPIPVLVFSADGKILVASSTDTDFWREDENGNWHLDRRSDGYFVGFLSNQVVALLFRKNDKERWGWIELQDITGAVLKSISCDHITRGFCYGYSPDEKWFLTCDEDGILSIYEAETLRFVTRTSLFPKKGDSTGRVYQLRFTPDGRELFFISGAQLFRGRFKTTGPTFVPKGLCFSANAKVRVGDDYQFSARHGLLAFTNEKLLTFEVYTSASLRKVLSVKDDSGHLLAFSPDGKYLACADVESYVSIRNIATGQLQHKFLAHPGPLMEQMSSIESIAWSPRGDILATGGSVYEINDYRIKLWKIE